MRRRYRNLDGNRCRRLSGFQMLNDGEVVTSVQAESDPADDETDEDEDNNNKKSSKGPSNAGAFCALETSMEWYEQQSECCPTQLLLLKRVRDLADKKRRCTLLKFNQKNNQKVLFSKLLHVPKWPRDRAVADFRIATRHDCLSKHLNMIGIAQNCPTKTGVGVDMFLATPAPTPFIQKIFLLHSSNSTALITTCN
ncbi:uncharacterized protein TNCV_405771 [Trichonephila clavipes]|nr:uncharacterized protein TNCV_405771 [Trichonephila clavipes]